MPSFDLPGTLRRIRRLADLSQRQLAAACGLSQSAVAQAESGRRDLPVGALTRAAEQAGLRLALLDAAGHEVAGMSPDAVRDLYGRRFPAHLDTHFADEREGRYEHRYDRRRPWFTVDGTGLPATPSDAAWARPWTTTPHDPGTRRRSGGPGARRPHGSAGRRRGAAGPPRCSPAFPMSSPVAVHRPATSWTTATGGRCTPRTAPVGATWAEPAVPPRHSPLGVSPW